MHRAARDDQSLRNTLRFLAISQLVGRRLRNWMRDLYRLRNCLHIERRTKRLNCRASHVVRISARFVQSVRAL